MPSQAEPGCVAAEAWGAGLPPRAPGPGMASIRDSPLRKERAPAWCPAAEWRSWGALPTGSQLPTGAASSVAVRQEAGEEFLPKVWTCAARYAATRWARLVDLHCSHPAARSHKALTCSVATCIRGCHPGGQMESLVIHVGGSGWSSGAFTVTQRHRDRVHPARAWYLGVCVVSGSHSSVLSFTFKFKMSVTFGPPGTSAGCQQCSLPPVLAALAHPHPGRPAAPLHRPL